MANPGDDTANSKIYFPGEATGYNSGGASASIPINKAVYSTGSGVKFTDGVGTLSGTNPTFFLHGLSTCQSVSVTLSGITTPGVGTSAFTTSVSGSYVNVYAWKPTSSGNPTLIASTGTESFYWLAAGI